MKKPLQNIIAQWKQKFASLSDENAWKGKVTSKIILKLIAQNKDKKKKAPKSKIYLFFTQIIHSSSKNTYIRYALSLIKNGFQKFYAISHVSMLLLFFIIYICIWHPGLDSRYIPSIPTSKIKKTKVIPPRSKIYSIKNVKIEIDTRMKTIALYLGDRKVASYFARMQLLARGLYFIGEIKEKARGTIAYIYNRSRKGQIILTGTSSFYKAKEFVIIDDDHWDMLSLYVRKNTLVRVF